MEPSRFRKATPIDHLPAELGDRLPDGGRHGRLRLKATRRLARLPCQLGAEFEDGQKKGCTNAPRDMAIHLLLETGIASGVGPRHPLELKRY